MAKDNFLYAIIDRSEEQRKLAVNQSNTLSELSKKIEIEVRLYHEAKMCEVIKFQGFHQSLISIFIGQKKFGFTKDEKYQWNSFLNKFLIICKESGRSLENFIPSRV